MEGEIWGLNPSQNMQLQIAAATWRMQMRSWAYINSAFYKIALVLVSTSRPENSNALTVFTKWQRYTVKH